MKNAFFLLGINILCCLTAHGQIEINRPIEEYGFNKNTVVVNNKGVKYTYAEWQKLISTGNYELQPVHHDSDSTSFVLVKRDEEAENKAFSKLAKPDETKFFKNGSQFKFLEMKDMDGNWIRPSDLQHKIVVLNFWFIACPPCRYEMPELNRLVKSYRNDKDIVFIAINLDSRENVQKFLKVSPFNYRVVSNAMGLFSFYGVDQCPASLVVDKDGIIRFNSQGYGNGSVPYWIKKTIAGIK